MIFWRNLVSIPLMTLMLQPGSVSLSVVKFLWILIIGCAQIHICDLYLILLLYLGQCEVESGPKVQTSS